MTLNPSSGLWLEDSPLGGQVWPQSLFLPRHFQLNFTGNFTYGVLTGFTPSDGPIAKAILSPKILICNDRCVMWL